MPARRHIDAETLRRARRGDLTRANTAKGTPERQAVDRAIYERRQAKRRPGESVRQRVGHPAAQDVPPRVGVFLDGPPRWAELELSRGDARRAGRYMALVGQLAEEKISARAFERRVASWRPIASHRFLANPGAVFALLDQRRAGEEEVFYYESGRAA